MLAWIKLILNPMNWSKLFSVVSQVLSLIRAAIDFFRKRAQEKKLEELRRLEEALKEANKIDNDDERVRKKAEVMCAIEKKRNPAADCDR